MAGLAVVEMISTLRTTSPNIVLRDMSGTALAYKRITYSQT